MTNNIFDYKLPKYDTAACALKLRSKKLLYSTLAGEVVGEVVGKVVGVVPGTYYRFDVTGGGRGGGRSNGCSGRGDRDGGGHARFQYV